MKTTPQLQPEENAKIYEFLLHFDECLLWIDVEETTRFDVFKTLLIDTRIWRQKG